MTTYHDVIETRFGWMGLLRSEKGLMRTTLPQTSPDRCIQILGDEMAGAEHAPERFTSLAGSLRRYFEGDKLGLVEETLDLEGATPFHRQAWHPGRQAECVEGRRAVHGQESVADSGPVPPGHRRRWGLARFWSRRHATRS